SPRRRPRRDGRQTAPGMDQGGPGERRKLPRQRPASDLLTVRDEPEPDRPRQSRRGAGGDPLCIDARDQRVEWQPFALGCLLQLVPEQRLETDRGLVPRDLDRTLDWRVIELAHSISTCAGRR